MQTTSKQNLFVKYSREDTAVEGIYQNSNEVGVVSSHYYYFWNQEIISNKNVIAGYLFGQNVMGHLPQIVGFRPNMARQGVFFVDFDKIPDHFLTSEHGASLTSLERDNFCETIRLLANHKNKVRGHKTFAYFTSRSGMPKLAFKVTFDNPVDKSNSKHAFDAVKEFIQETFDIHAEGLDLSITAITRSFISDQDSLDVLTDGLSSLSPVELEVCEPFEKQVKEFFVHEGDLPKRLAPYIKNGSDEKIARILVRCWNLETEFDLPQIKLAKEAKTSQRAVSQFLSRLKLAGLLIEVDSSYFSGIKAKTYRAAGVLLSAILSIKKKTFGFVKEKAKEIRDALMMKLPKSGEWDSWLFKFTKTFYQKEELEESLSKLEGIRLKGRYKKALHQFRCVEKYRKTLSIS